MRRPHLSAASGRSAGRRAASSASSKSASCASRSASSSPASAAASACGPLARDGELAAWRARAPAARGARSPRARRSAASPRAARPARRTSRWWPTAAPRPRPRPRGGSRASVPCAPITRERGAQDRLAPGLASRRVLVHLCHQRYKRTRPPEDEMIHSAPLPARQHHLRGPVRALGARQLEGHRDRLLRGRASSGRASSPTSSAPPRSGTTRSSSGARTPWPTASRPYIDAAPLEEQKYFLATQQVDEARHAVFFKRFMEEVVGIGGGSVGDAPRRRSSPQLTWGFRKVFDRLEQHVRRAARATARSRKLAPAITLYHVVIEATLAQPGQHFITSYLRTASSCPASARAWRTWPRTSSATSASA